MARKNLLAGLMEPKLPAGNSAPDALADEALDTQQPPRQAPLGSRGAIGAVTRSIESLKSAASEAGEIRARLEAGQTVVELDPGLIDPSPVTDRMPVSSNDLAEFIGAIQASGQQVPILVRPHPETQGRYQIAYGHRRALAARELGRSVRAVVRVMSDAELVIAQGQENSARRDLSFIERALYAAKLQEAGFERETLMAALNVDKTGLSRLISAAVKIPRDIIEGIGPAPRVGRDRWTELTAKLEALRSPDAVRELLASELFQAAASDERFEMVLRAAQAPRAKPRAAGTGRVLVDPEGKAIGRMERAGKAARLVLTEAAFAEFLAGEVPRLHATWRSAGPLQSKPGGAPTKKS
jgi:ParB family chromosome partitioning protein